jgi:hypothetical protein
MLFEYMDLGSFRRLMELCDTTLSEEQIAVVCSAIAR